jgi:hypothetical protein
MQAARQRDVGGSLAAAADVGGSAAAVAASAAVAAAQSAAVAHSATAAALAAAQRLWQIHRHRPQMRHQQPADVRLFVLGRGIVVVGSDGGARGDVHRGRRCAAAVADDANGNADDIVC